MEGHDRLRLQQTRQLKKKIHPKMHTISSTVAVSQPNPRTMWFGKPIDPIGLTMRIMLGRLPRLWSTSLQRITNSDGQEELGSKSDYKIITIYAYLGLCSRPRAYNHSTTYMRIEVYT